MSMFNTIRLCIGIPAFLLVKISIVKKTGKRRALILFAFFILFALLYMLPVENLVYRFDTPEKSFQYSYGQKEIHQVYRKGDNALFIFSDKDTWGYQTFEKDHKGWKIRTPNYDINPSIRYHDTIVISKIRAGKEINAIVVCETVFPKHKPLLNDVGFAGNLFKTLTDESSLIKVVYYFDFMDSAIRTIELNEESVQLP